MKKCPRCKQLKPIKEFSKSKTRAGGTSSVCKKCNALYQREWKSKNPERSKEVYYKARLKHLYGISPDDVIEMRARQGGVCKICGSKPFTKRCKTELHIDHCHVTGKIRGLLCNTCNRVLGFLEDDYKIAMSMAEYLMYHKQQGVN